MRYGKLAGAAGAAAMVVAAPAAQAAEAFKCPADLRQLERMLSPREVVDVIPDDGWDLEQRFYDPSQFSVLGIEPTAVFAEFDEGKPVYLKFELPVEDPNPYLQSVRTLVGSGGYSLECEDGAGCEWGARQYIDSMPKGALKGVDFERDFDDEGFRFECRYRIN